VLNDTAIVVIRSSRVNVCSRYWQQQVEVVVKGGIVVEW